MAALLPALAIAGPLDVFHASLQSSISSATAMLQSKAIIWLSSFVLMQFLITNIGLLKSGADMEAIIGKFMGSMLWFGFCFYVMSNGADFIASVSKGFFTTAGDLAGSGGFDAGSIIDSGCTLAGNLLTAINKASGITDLFMPAVVGVLLGAVILATAALIAFKVFLVKIEVMIIIMMAPLSFSFLGLNALKDQGIAPFKALISLLYRVLLLALILKTMDGMSESLQTVIGSITADSINGIWGSVFAAVIGYVLLAFLVFKSDSIASSLASGSTNLGTADVASAAAMGAATGAAVVAGGSALASALKGPLQMSDVIKNMVGGGGSSIANASARGIGSTPSPAPARGASMSTSGGAPAPASGGAPVRPASAGTSGASGVVPSGGTSGASAIGNPSGAPSRNAAPGDGAAAPSRSAESASAALSGEPESGAVAVPQSGSSAPARPDSGTSGQSDAGTLPESGSGGSNPFPDAPTRAESGALGAASALGGAPKRDDKSTVESGLNAGIGAASPAEQKIDQLSEAMARMSAPKKPSVSERLGTLGKHIEQEKAATHVSINTHHSD